MHDTNIYLDVESIPTQDPRIIQSLREQAQEAMKSALAAVTAPSNYKDEAKIAEYIGAKRAEIQEKAIADLDVDYRKTALDGAFCQIVVCSIAAGDEEPFAIYGREWQAPGAEATLLAKVNERLADICKHHRGQMLVGHNIIGFDRKVLRQRGIINGVRMHQLLTKAVKPWETDTVFDTMLAWSGDPRDKASMDKLCLAFGIEGKGSGMDGSKVWDAVREGRIDEVATYCNDDVRRTRAMYRRMNYLGLTEPRAQFEDVSA